MQYLQNNGGYVVATKGNPSGTPGSDSYKNIEFGYIFNNCVFTGDENVMPGSVSLARGWDAGMTMMVVIDLWYIWMVLTVLKPTA